MESTQELPTTTANAGTSRNFSRRLRIVLTFFVSCGSLQHSWKTLRTLEINRPWAESVSLEELNELSDTLSVEQASSTTAPASVKFGSSAPEPVEVEELPRLIERQTKNSTAPEVEELSELLEEQTSNSNAVVIEEHSVLLEQQMLNTTAPKTVEVEEHSVLLQQKTWNNTASATNEVKIPPQSLEESFSACLMLMDSNHRIAEWVAYHYYALPLRTLVVFVDPFSRTHPREVLRKWEPYIDITYWNKVTDIGLSVGHLNSTTPQQVKKITRQTNFMGACAWDLRKRNRTWAMFVDVDEYLLFDHNKLPDQVPLTTKPGFVSELINKAENEESMPEKWRLKLSNRTCMTVPRVMYAAVESEKDEVLSAGVPDYLDPYRFNTARFRHYSDLWSKKNSLGKGLLRVDRWDAGRQQSRFGVHRLVGECPGAFASFKEHPLRINHYVGSWETYSFINDPRYLNKTKARIRWEGLSKLESHPKRGGKDDMIRSWISNFANWQGEKATQYLLSDIGPPFNSSSALFRGEPYVLE